jgi:hypothetical protein
MGQYRHVGKYSGAVNLTFGARALLEEFDDGLEKVGPLKWKENLCDFRRITNG